MYTVKPCEECAFYRDGTCFKKGNYLVDTAYMCWVPDGCLEPFKEEPA